MITAQVLAMIEQSGFSVESWSRSAEGGDSINPVSEAMKVQVRSNRLREVTLVTGLSEFSNQPVSAVIVKTIARNKRRWTLEFAIWAT